MRNIQILSLTLILCNCSTNKSFSSASPGSPSVPPKQSTSIDQRAALPPISATILAGLKSIVRSPEDLDPATKALGINARLVNFALATTLTTPLGPATYLPIQISSREGGRKSTYFLASGEEVVTGALLVAGNIYYRKVRRDSGLSLPAVSGDRYTEFMVDGSDGVINKFSGVLEVLDAEHGLGHLNSDPTSLTAGDDEPICPFWQCYSTICGRPPIDRNPDEE